jgi:N-acetylneuraminic acid mutarotase
MKLFSTSVAAIALFAMPLAAHAQAPQGSWSVVGQMTTSRTDIGVVETGGKIYVMGGQANGRTDSPMAQEFDPANLRWRDLAPAPRGGSHVGIAAMNGKIYMAGGFLANVHKNPIDQLAEYTIATNSWKTLAPLPRPLGAAGLAAVGGKLHVIGGRGPDAKTVTYHGVYDVAAGTWSMAAPLPLARDHLGIIVEGGKIYVVGGRTDQTVDNSGQTDVYDPSTDKWQTVAPMPTKRSSGAIAVYKGQIIFFGGECKNPQTRATFDENEGYDPKTNRWTALARPPTGLHAGGFGAAANTAYFFGGNQGCGGDNPSTSVWAFKLP